MAEQPVMQPEQNPEAMRGAVSDKVTDEAQASEAMSEAQEIHERFIVNVMKLASGKHFDAVVSYMSEAKSPSQGLGKALVFMLEMVTEGLRQKGVDVPAELWLAENGIIEQSARIISMLGISAGIDLNRVSLAEGMEMAAEAMAEIEQGKRDRLQQNMQAPPNQAQQGGLLSQSGGA